MKVRRSWTRLVNWVSSANLWQLHLLREMTSDNGWMYRVKSTGPKMMCTVSRLEVITEIVVKPLAPKLMQHNFLEQFGEKLQDWHRSVVDRKHSFLGQNHISVCEPTLATLAQSHKAHCHKKARCVSQLWIRFTAYRWNIILQNRCAVLELLRSVRTAVLC